MKKSTGWILASLTLVTAITVLVLLYKFYGFLAGCALGVLFFVGINQLHKRRVKRLLKSLTPGETLVARGLVSESTYDETPAILVRGAENYFRVDVSDSRGSQLVGKVSPGLTSHTNVYDLKKYIELHTDQAVVHFAPHQGMSVAVQPAYAQQVLEGMLASGIPVKN